MTPSLLRLLTPPLTDWPERLARWRAFFAFHGVWAPGVRLMRTWSFRRKLGLVMLMLGLPLVVLTLMLVRDRWMALQAAETRLRGAQIVDGVYAFGGSFHDEWQALNAGRSHAATAPTAAFEALERVIASAKPLSPEVEAAWSSARPLFERAMTDGGTAGLARRELLSQVLSAVVEIKARTVEASGLLRERDSELSLRAELAYETLPALQVEIARLRGQALRHAVLSGRPDATAAELRSSLLALAMRLEAAERELAKADHGLARVRALSPGAAGETGLGRARALVQSVRVVAVGLDATFDAAGIEALGTPAREEILTLRLSQSAELQRLLGEERERASRALAAVGGIVALLLLLSLYAVYSLFLVMDGGLKLLERQMERMAAGDLSARPVAHGDDEVGRTIDAMTRSLAGLSDLLASVRDGVGAVTQAAQLVADGNGELSGRNRSTNENLQTLVAGVAAYTEQLQACGRQVEAVVGAVQSLRLQAARNRKHMVRLRERLQALQGKSREIGEIVTLIDTIAFRTNILALNASVEASKAGEAGRGFAVVAQEVRSLAQRSAESARRIGDIITRSTEDIDESGALADEAGRSMQESDAHVDQIHVAMTDVATLTRSGEQQSADILSGITKLENSTLRNLELVDQLAEASQALRSQGERLAGRVAQFNLS